MMKLSTLKIKFLLFLFISGISYSFSQVNISSFNDSKSNIEYEYEYETPSSINSSKASSKQVQIQEEVEYEYEYEYVSKSEKPVIEETEFEYEYEYVYEDGSVETNNASVPSPTINDDVEIEVVKEEKVNKYKENLKIDKKIDNNESIISTKKIESPVVVKTKTVQPVNETKVTESVVVEKENLEDESIYSEEIKKVILKDNVTLKDISCTGSNEFYAWSSRINQNPWIESTVDKYGNQLGENVKNISISIEKDIKLKNTAPKESVAAVVKDPNPFDKVNQPAAYELWNKAHANNTVISKSESSIINIKDQKEAAKTEAQLGSDKCAAQNKLELDELTQYYQEKGYKVFVR